jgi:hypothetical protein
VVGTLVPVGLAMTELAAFMLQFSGNRVVSGTRLFRPRRADPGGDPRAGGFRTALAALFPVAPSVPPGPAGLLRERPVRVAIEILAVLAAAVAMLLRVAHIPVWDLVYAEDNGVFLVGALAHPWDLLAPFGGYLELVPRILGQIVSLLPVWDAARVYAVSGALIAALCALFTYHASEGYIWSPWLRAMLGAALILLPLAPIEMADSGVASPWYLLATAFWAVLWRPRTGAGRLAAALMAFAAASSEIVAVIYIPLLVIRVIALPRWREHAVTIGFLLGLLAQVPAILSTYARHAQRLHGLGQPLASVKFYVHAFVLRSVGWHLSWGLQRLLGLNAATAVVGAFLLAVLAWVLITGDRQVRVFAVLATVLGFVQVIAVASVPGPPGTGWVAHQVAVPTFQPGSRYDAVPVMLLNAMVIIAVDTFIRRRGAIAPAPAPPPQDAWRGPRPWALIAVTALTCALAFGWVSDYRYYVPSRVSQGYWTNTVHHWLKACAKSKTGEISLTLWAAPKATVPCSRIRR